MHPAEQYIHDVLSGKITTGKWARLAVERHVNDLRNGHKRGLRFDRAKAERAIRFFGFLKHSKGEWAGQTFELSPWQQFILWCLFGWRRIVDGLRRFRMAYVEVARKNGKSTFAAGVGLELFAGDGEPGAEVYTAATKRDQARIVHSEAVRMVKASPELKTLISVLKDNLFLEETAAKFVPLGADSDTTDGLNPHGAIVDELHAHKTRGLLDVLDSATGARRQPMILIITTAGSGRIGVCWDQHAYSEKILEGIIEDDAFFCMVFAIDEEDDWRDPKNWQKANPGLGISVKLDDLERKAKKADQMPSFQNEFLRKHLNRWTEQAKRWIRMEKWRQCANPVADADLAGRRCFLGVDLSTKLDITAAVYCFPPIETDRRWRYKGRFWVPEETALQREEDAKVPYKTWGDQGHLFLTPGNVIDYDYIRAQIEADAKVWQVEEIGYDPFNATQLVLQLQAQGMTVVEVQQGFKTLNSPSKELEKQIVCGDFAHDGNPVFDWMASNVAAETDAAGNIKPSKSKSTEKIDGIAATVTALARAMFSDSNKQSVYETRGMLTT
jgi:phage terminase large subunit-like protein